jgi:beta-N-acetylglucosaminidase
MMNNDDKKDSLYTFQLIDVNLDGELSYEEIKELMTKKGILDEKDYEVYK